MNNLTEIHGFNLLESFAGVVLEKNDNLNKYQIKEYPFRLSLRKITKYKFQSRGLVILYLTKPDCRKQRLHFFAHLIPELVLLLENTSSKTTACLQHNKQALNHIHQCYKQKYKSAIF